MRVNLATCKFPNDAGGVGFRWPFYLSLRVCRHVYHQFTRAGAFWTCVCLAKLTIHIRRIQPFVQVYSESPHCLLYWRYARVSLFDLLYRRPAYAVHEVLPLQSEDRALSVDVDAHISTRWPSTNIRWINGCVYSVLYRHTVPLPIYILITCIEFQVDQQQWPTV